MPPIVFPSSSAPGKDAIESAGRLVNAYAERLQEGAPAPYVIRRPPGLTLFGDSDEVNPRGLWFDGSARVYAAYSSSLSYFGEDGSETAVDDLPDGAVSYTGRYSSASDLSSYTLAAVPLGDEDADRRIVAGIAAMEYEGSELVTNGTFDTNIASWTDASAAFVWDGGGGNGYARCFATGTYGLDQSISTTNGATYRIRVTGRDTAGGTVTVKWGGATLGSFSTASSETYEVVATGASMTLRVEITTAGGLSHGFDVASVKRVQFALPTGVTIGAVVATAVATATRAVLYIANVPTGATGDIVLTYAQTMNECYVAVWRLGGVTSSTPTDADATTATPGAASVAVPAGGVVCAITQQSASIGWTRQKLNRDLHAVITASGGNRHSGFSGFSPVATTASVTSNGPQASVAMAAWQGEITAIGNGVVTFAKNNASTPDQVLCVSGTALVEFDNASVGSPISVNSEVPTSVCFGEGYFFVGTSSGLCYASGLNAITFSALDYTRMEQRPETVVRNLFWDSQLLSFGATHIEVFASGGNPNLSGFPLNYVTSIWRGLIAPLAVTGFEEGFEGGLFFVADDNSVRMLQGYNPVTISTAPVERAIEACTDKSAIRAFCYDVDGHACVVIDLAGQATWVYDLTEGGNWHERDTAGNGYWRATGNSVKAFGKWLVGDHDSGNIYQIDKDAMTDGGSSMAWEAESIAMEAFPQRLQVPRADFNFVSGVGTATVQDPKVTIQWSDDGGHRWSDPVTRKLGEAGRYLEHIRVNRLGLTGVKGRRFRLTVEDQVYVGLLAGSMEVSGRP